MLSVEYILTASGSPPADEIYHIILRYDTNAPANAELYYFSTGSGGDLATIGVQGFDSSDNMQSAQFEFDTPDSIAPNDRIVLTTDPVSLPLSESESALPNAGALRHVSKESALPIPPFQV